MSEHSSPRDPGLQAERTALSWHRTTFSILLFSLAAVKIAFARGNAAAGMLSLTGALLALALVGLTWHRRHACGESLVTTPSARLAKRLISIALSLASFSLVLPALMKLIFNGDL
ncbi:TPA: DUF202 domain-containing protein [Citrobacter freundii]